MAFGLGDSVPAFSLPDTEGGRHGVPLDEPPPATVLTVTCLHCPYVIAWNPRLRAVAEEYGPHGVRFLGIHSNDAGRYPADSIDHMRRFVRAHRSAGERRALRGRVRGVWRLMHDIRA